MTNEQNIDPKEKLEPVPTRRTSGYTLVELLGVTTIVILAVLATQGMLRNYKRFAIEEAAVQRLKELSAAENTFRHTSDPAVNPNGTYGTFFDLQSAKLIPDLYAKSDERRHTVNAYVPFYRLNWVEVTGDKFKPGANDEDVKPNAYEFLIRAEPLGNSLGLKTFYVGEDGEVFWQRYLWNRSR